MTEVGGEVRVDINSKILFRFTIQDESVPKTIHELVPIITVGFNKYDLQGIENTFIPLPKFVDSYTMANDAKITSNHLYEIRIWSAIEIQSLRYIIVKLLFILLKMKLMRSYCVMEVP